MSFGHKGFGRNPSNYKPTRCTGSSNYPDPGATKTNGVWTNGVCSTCKKPVALTKTGLVKAHD